MSSARMSFGAILNTVQTTADTVTNVVDSANKSVGMLTAFVEKAAVEQKIRHMADGETFVDLLMHEKAETYTAMAIKADKFCNQSAKHAEYYNAAIARFTKLLKPTAEA